jgi:GNAT superfamily N-acetyltransferase
VTETRPASTRAEIHIRAATPADFPALGAILAVTDEPVDWPGRPGWPYLEHLLGRARMLTATVADDVVAFGGSVAVGGSGARFLTDLFVDPSRQEGGVGQAILEAALDGATASMTCSSSDPRALGLYIRAGMRPWWPLLYVGGDLGDRLVPDTALTVEPADVGTTARWSAAWTGIDRSRDFAYYAGLPGARGHLVREGGEVAAIGWSRSTRDDAGRWLEFGAIAPDGDPAAAAATLWTAAADGGRLTAPIPGPHAVVPRILAAGGRIEGWDTFCATVPDLVDPARLLPNPALF